MKLRLPLLLATILVSQSVLTAAPIESPVLGNVTATDSQTFTDLSVGSADESAHLTLNLGNNEITVSGRFLTNARNAAGEETRVTLNSGTLTLNSSATGTGTADRGVHIGGTNDTNVSRTVYFTMNGGTMNCLNTVVYLSNWMQKGVFDLNAGTANLLGVVFWAPENPPIFNLNGGTLNLGARGLGVSTRSANETTADRSFQFNFTGGVLGALADWSTADVYVPEKYVFSTGSNNSDVTFDTKNPETSAAHTITMTIAIEGTGSGNMIVTGGGSLFLNSLESTFAKTIVLDGVTLGAEGDGALGSASGIKVISDSTFTTPGTTSISKNFEVTDGSTLTLMGRTSTTVQNSNNRDMIQYRTTAAGDFTSSPVEFTGNISLQDDSSLLADNVIVHFKDGVTSNAYTLNARWNSTVNVENATVNFSVSTSGIGVFSIGSYNNGTLARSYLNINNGGVFNAPHAALTLSTWNNRGALNVNNGGTINVKGLFLEGWGGVANINGGTLALGSDGIYINNGTSAEPRNDDTVGKIYFNAGTIVFNETASYRLNSDLALDAGGYMTLGGNTSQERIIEVASGATASIESVIAGASGFIKTGNGTLQTGKIHLFTGELEVRGGMVDLGTTGSLAATSMKLWNGSTVTGSWISGGTFSGPFAVTGNDSAIAARWDGPMNATSLTMTNTKALLSINGDLVLSGDLTVNVDTASNQIGPMITLSGTNTVSTTGKIIFNAPNSALEQAGEGIINLQLFNVTALAGLTGFNPSSNIVWNRTDEKFSFNTDSFLTTGTVIWSNSELSMDLLTIAQGASTTPYTPGSSTVYVGARDPEVTFALAKAYNSVDGNTRLTNGHGNFIFQPAVADTGDLYVLGMMGGSGKVILAHNNNAQQSTKITDVTLAVDSSRGTALQLVLPGETPVGILGSGNVDIYGSSTSAGALELRTGGDTDRSGTYLIANTITLHENAVIVQSGANSHKLTGTITQGYSGYGFIRNESAEDLIIEADITGPASSQLIFRGEAGKVVLSGGNPLARAAAHSMTRDTVYAEGDFGLEVANGFILNAGTIDISPDSLLTISGNAVINLGGGGITEGRSIDAGDGTINADVSSTIRTEVNLTGNTTFNTADSPTILTLEKGITGTGNLVKTGDGRLVINTPTTTSTSGVITLWGGSLQLGQPTNTNLADGTPLTASYQLNGGLDIQSGTLSGIIDAGGNAIHFGSGAVLSLAIDTVNTAGSYILNAGDVTVDNGAAILVNILEQGWSTGRDYFIISSNTAIQGDRFQLLQDGEFAFVDVALTQTEKNVKLNLTAKVPDIEIHSANQGAVAPVISRLALMALEGRRGDLSGNLLDMMQIVSKMKTDDLGAFVAETANSTASLYTALAGQVINTAQHVKSVRNRVVNLDPLLFDKYVLTDNRNIWVEGISQYNDIDSDGNAMGYRLETWGANMGVSFSLGSRAFFGIGFGYMSAETRSKGSYGENTTDSYNMDIFGRYKKDNFSISAVVSGGFSHANYKRFLMFNGERLRADGKSNGSQVMGMIEASYDLALNESGTSILQPVVNISTGYAQFRGFDEHGDMGNAGYHVASQDITPTTIGAGVRYVYTRLSEGYHTPLRGEIRAMVTQDVGDVTYNVTANYLGASAYKMNVTGVPVERTAFVIGASGALPVSLYSQIFIDVAGEFRDNQNGLSASVGMNFMF